jgi:hypothetical protein
LIRPGRPGGRFAPPRVDRTLKAGRWVSVADIDGRRGQDILIVQSCGNDRNIRDILLLDKGRGWGWRQPKLPTGGAGCGDISHPIDLTGDGRLDFVVLNGRWASDRPPGRPHVLTTDSGVPRQPVVTTEGVPEGSTSEVIPFE